MMTDEMKHPTRPEVALGDILAERAIEPMPTQARERVRAMVLPVATPSSLRSTRLVFARSAALFACFGTLLTGASYAAAHSLPGDPLYPLKRATQEMRVILVTGDARGDVLIDLTDSRAEEVRLLMLERASESRVQTAVDGFEDAAGRAVESAPDSSTAQERVRRIEDAVSDEPAKVQQRVKAGIPQTGDGTGSGTGTGSGPNTGGGTSGGTGSGSGTGSGTGTGSGEPGGGSRTVPSPTPTPGTGSGGGPDGSPSSPEDAPGPVSPKAP